MVGSHGISLLIVAVFFQHLAKALEPRPHLMRNVGLQDLEMASFALGSEIKSRKGHSEKKEIPLQPAQTPPGAEAAPQATPAIQTTMASQVATPVEQVVAIPSAVSSSGQSQNVMPTAPSQQANFGQRTYVIPQRAYVIPAGGAGGQEGLPYESITSPSAASNAQPVPQVKQAVGAPTQVVQMQPPQAQAFQTAAIPQQAPQLAATVPQVQQMPQLPPQPLAATPPMPQAPQPVVAAPAAPAAPQPSQIAAASPTAPSVPQSPQPVAATPAAPQPPVTRVIAPQLPQSVTPGTASAPQSPQVGGVAPAMPIKQQPELAATQPVVAPKSTAPPQVVAQTAMPAAVPSQITGQPAAAIVPKDITANMPATSKVAESKAAISSQRYTVIMVIIGLINLVLVVAFMRVYSSNDISSVFANTINKFPVLQQMLIGRKAQKPKPGVPTPQRGPLSRALEESSVTSISSDEEPKHLKYAAREPAMGYDGY